jgi:hypothetical protein
MHPKCSLLQSLKHNHLINAIVTIPYLSTKLFVRKSMFRSYTFHIATLNVAVRLTYTRQMYSRKSFIRGKALVILAICNITSLRNMAFFHANVVHCYNSMIFSVCVVSSYCVSLMKW